MKKLLIFVVLFFVMIPAVGAQADLPETYVDPDGKFMINYPKGWRTVTGGLGVDFIIPSSFSYLSLYLNDFEDDPVDALEIYVSLHESKVEIEEFTSSGRPAAQMIVHEGISSAYFAVNYAPRATATLVFIATQDEVRRWQSTLVAMLDSLTVPNESDILAEPEIEVADALELNATYEDKTLTFAYPEAWFTSSYQGRVALSNVQRLAQYREPEFIYLEPEQVVLVFPNTDTLPGIVRTFLDYEEEITPYSVALLMGIDVLVEGEGSNSPEIEAFSINGRDAAMTSVASESEDYLVITIELENGDIATIVTIADADGLPSYQKTVEALVETLALVE